MQTIFTINHKGEAGGQGAQTVCKGDTVQGSSGFGREWLSEEEGGKPVLPVLLILVDTDKGLQDLLESVLKLNPQTVATKGEREFCVREAGLSFPIFLAI